MEKMRDSMNLWLKKKGMPEVDVKQAHILCHNLGLDGEQVDNCLIASYQFEKGEINETDFIIGLSMLANKKPEEVEEILKGTSVAHVIPEIVIPKEHSHLPTKADYGLGTLYHGTVESRGKDILDRGINLGEDGVAWLAYSKKDAQEVAEETAKMTGGKPIVFEVNLPDGWHLEKAAEGEYLSRDFIPNTFVVKQPVPEAKPVNKLPTIQETRQRIEEAAKKLGLNPQALMREYGVTTALSEMLEKQEAK